MGNLISDDSEKYYNSHYAKIENDEIQNLRNRYKVIEIDRLDSTLVNSKIVDDKYFEKLPKKKEIINNMLEYYLNDKDEDNRHIYKKTDYLCNESEKICICNTHAEDFRKLYDGINYRPNIKYISWCKKNSDNF